MLVRLTVQFYWPKAKTGQDSLHYLVYGPTVQVLSTPWADSTVVPSGIS